MSDKMDEMASADANEIQGAAETRAAWLGLIRLLAREVIRRLDQGESATGADTTSQVTGSLEPRPGARDRLTGRS